MLVSYLHAGTVPPYYLELKSPTKLYSLVSCLRNVVHVTCTCYNIVQCTYPTPLTVAEADEDEEWAEETTEGAGGEGIDAQLSSLTVSSDQDKTHEEKLEIFFNFVEVRITWC